MKKNNELSKPYSVVSDRLLSFSFHSFEELEAFGKNWSFYSRYRFGVGEFSGRFDICQHPDYQLAQTSYNDGLMFSGFAPQNCISLVQCTRKRGSLTANRNILEENEIIIIDDKKAYEIIFNDISKFNVLSLKKELIEEKYFYLLKMIGRVYIDEEGHFKAFFNDIFNSDRAKRDERSCKDETIALKMFHALDKLDLLSKEPVKKRLTKKESLLFDIRAYILSNLQFELSIKELSNRFNISERALQYGFQKIFGITPKRFIKTLRLNEVHKEILKTKGEVKISQVAIKWGFENFGRFSHEYQKIYGLLPSEERKRLSK